MANIYDFKIKAVGNRKDINEFESYLEAGYDYSDKNSVWDADHHVFRMDEVWEEDFGDNWSIFEGSCAWSVSSAMLEEGYYSTIKANYPDNFRGITLPEASKLLNIDIEVYSFEEGGEFSEHYLYKHGETIEEKVKHRRTFNFDKIKWEI